ncbi:hypothetical protein [Candidatus Tisiphia endosymbiont of Nemotelus uliginosus]|uniref:hypothetical protein n=1 Tax=Candidatus Tisiphia endosymbiont of Nemotelus uliginosus TaxID=3077926 RepID=UPI0035C93124
MEVQIDTVPKSQDAANTITRLTESGVPTPELEVIRQILLEGHNYSSLKEPHSYLSLATSEALLALYSKDHSTPQILQEG